MDKRTQKVFKCCKCGYKTIRTAEKEDSYVICSKCSYMATEQVYEKNRVAKYERLHSTE